MSYQSPLLNFSRTNPNNGMLFDIRDGQSYQVVKIGNQIWTAENFRYLPSIKDNDDLFENSLVYDNDNSYLEKGYGRLYGWNTAMNIAPEGWKLPSDKDFIELRDFITKDNNLVEYEEGSYLKSVDGWDKPCDGIVNLDKYGFNAKPAGCYSNNRFHNAGNNAYFWSAFEINRTINRYWYLICYSEGFHNNNYIGSSKYNVSSNYKGNGFSVRLIKDI